MKNAWNKVIYKIWSPLYDKVFNAGIFLNTRKKVFERISFHNGQHILFAGVGTGADLAFMDASTLQITAIDLSPDMLNRAKEKFGNAGIVFRQMDAQNMEFADETFDVVVASLILSVVPDADKCLADMTRVLNKEGKLIVFDKFVPKASSLSLPKRLLRPFIKVLGTDIGLNFESLLEKHKACLMIEEDEPVMFNGMYRKIILRKIHSRDNGDL